MTALVFVLREGQGSWVFPMLRPVTLQREGQRRLGSGSNNSRKMDGLLRSLL